MKRHAIRAEFEIHFIQCGHVENGEVCGDERIKVVGSFPDREDALEIESLTCGYKHEIDPNSLSAFDETRVLEYAELRRGDFIASYCEQICEREDL